MRSKGEVSAVLFDTVQRGFQGDLGGCSIDIASLRAERSFVYFDMRALIEDFGISRSQAAEAVIEKFELELSLRTLVNSFESRAKYPDLVRKNARQILRRVRRPRVFLTEGGRSNFFELVSR